MKRKSINILSLKNPLTNNHRSSKINNKFKKSSTTQYNFINKNTQYNNKNQNVNSINNNIYLNLFKKFNNISSLRKNQLNSKQIISTRINNSHISKERKNLNILDAASSSSIKRNNNDNPSIINSMNFINNHGHINIRLNLKNQFINNSNYNYNNITESSYGLEITEKMKEKNLKIIQLQNELLKSQEIINKFQANSNIDITKYNNLNNSSKENNLCLLTKSSESVDKILKTAFNGFIPNNSKNINKKKNSNRKSYKNSFLKKGGTNKIIECLKSSKIREKSENKKYTRDNSRTNRNIYSGYYKNKQSDYLRLFLPLSNFNNDKPKFNSYSNNKPNVNNKMKSNTDMNKTEKNLSYVNKDNSCAENKGNEDFLKLIIKCTALKEKTKNLLNKYIDLGEALYRLNKK